MKIALVNSEHPSPTGNDHGGIAAYTYTLGRLLAENGHTVHILTRSPIVPVRFPQSVHFHRFGYTKSNHPVIRILERIHRNDLAWEKGNARSVFQLLSELHLREGLDIADIPEYGGLGSGHPAGTPLPFIITFHTPSQLVDTLNNTPPSRMRRGLYRLERKGILRASGYKSPSNALKDHACAVYQLPSSSVHVIRNPFYFSDFPRHPRSRERFDILFSGRLERRKGAEIILHALQDLLAIGPDVYITIAGETEIGNALNYRQAIERQLSSEERERVWFPGPLPAFKLQSLYANSSILLFPSLFENCPYVLLEAMAAGLPVVASDGSGIGEIVAHRTSGLLFSPDDRAQLLSHVRALHDDREFAERLGEQASSAVRRQCNPESVINATVNFYQSVLDGGNKRA